jgi:hypothetical protein
MSFLHFEARRFCTDILLGLGLEWMNNYLLPFLITIHSLQEHLSIPTHTFATCVQTIIFSTIDAIILHGTMVKT